MDQKTLEQITALCAAEVQRRLDAATNEKAHMEGAMEGIRFLASELLKSMTLAVAPASALIPSGGAPAPDAPAADADASV